MLNSTGLEIGDKTYRNLEHQVKYLTEIYENLLSINVDGFNIHVVGSVDTAAELPNPAQYEGEYGDAFAVGEETPFDYYIFTRPFEGEDTPHWFNAGPLGIIGPEGPAGPKGDIGGVGPRGNSFFQGSTYPVSSVDFREGDTYLNTNTYKIYKYTNGTWQQTGQIETAVGPQGQTGATGPQGPQGPQGLKGDKGDQGDPGAFIRIVGSLPSASYLPLEPTSSEEAYIVGENHEVYITVGTPGDYTWTNIGSLNIATYVTVNGSFVNIWEANTKLDATKSAISNAGGLVIPTTTPTETILTGIGTGNNQVQIKLGDNLSLTGSTSPYTLNATGGGSKSYQHNIVLHTADFSQTVVFNIINNSSTVLTKNDFNTVCTTLRNQGFIGSDTLRSATGRVLVDGRALSLVGIYGYSNDRLVARGVTINAQSIDLSVTYTIITSTSFTYFKDTVVEI